MTAEHVLQLLPEIILASVAVLIYMGGVFRPFPWRWAALAGVAVAAAALAMRHGGPPPETVAADRLALFGRWLSLAAGGLLVLLAWRPLARLEVAEHFGSLLLLIAGMMLVAGASDLVLVFVGLELISIPTYILLYLARRTVGSPEATAKYFFLSVLSSAVFLYGLSFLYGVSGHTDLAAIRDELATGTGTFAPFGKVALVLIMAGLGFRITAVPFHFYAPDVYQGTTHANAGLLSVAPKIAGLLALVRLAAAALPVVQDYAWVLVVVLAMVTMTLGNVLALWQDNIRRLLAYSSIAHAGYLLVGLAVYLGTRYPSDSRWDGVGGLLFYLVVYSIATLGTFAALIVLSRSERQIDNVDELAGLAWSGQPMHRVLAWATAIFMFSLTGIPPMAGFWGKLAIFASALNLMRFDSDARPWFIVLAVVGVLNSAISAAYYLRIIGTMFFREAPEASDSKGSAGGPLVAALGCAVLAVLIGLYPGPWIRQANQAGGSVPIVESRPSGPEQALAGPR